LTIGNYPRKNWWVLAMGKPTIATRPKLWKCLKSMFI
jgi:hypothetical protein